MKDDGKDCLEEKKANEIKKNLPSGNIFGISAETAGIIIANLEHGSQWASVFAGVVVHADVVFAAIVGVSMAREGSGGDVGIRAPVTASDLLKMRKNKAKHELHFH